ncbi:hypothetical protein N781_12765 [Pontibacillus halophilus JSM 076056 = DSM 19796]|uniref:Myb-like domain-containing protein n=1 Tax=Pontibacillus halophilus JSM 076056 = DSM 19796 TaxID=1385510 RepID=A0A0A5GMP7_9BACI|nr:RsfA family transcriptional regulator [Pontibacillus halophilus]KGX93274.1 hypothetical protein N781_12765 [Pontibacillus halophilus JSM 076056 = DSM 19796]
MNATRQDAWTDDEDVLLAETVLTYIRNGTTQLEAFEEVARKLSRTSAACGFRWNATVRKQYKKAISEAKQTRKSGQEEGKREIEEAVVPEARQGFSIDDAILFLETMRNQSQVTLQESPSTDVKFLQEENERLKARLNRYHQAWDEMGKLWSWVSAQNKKD